MPNIKLDTNKLKKFGSRVAVRLAATLAIGSSVVSLIDNIEKYKRTKRGL